LAEHAAAWQSFSAGFVFMSVSKSERGESVIYRTASSAFIIVMLLISSVFYLTSWRAFAIDFPLQVVAVLWLNHKKEA
jgi:hypothetical protein